MKIPLHYQITEYDCCPTCIFNALSMLFEREEIPPEIIKKVIALTLDCHGKNDEIGKGGTSCEAMKSLSGWLCEYGRKNSFPIKCTYLAANDVFLGENSMINSSVKSGSVAILRLYFDVWHYVILTGVDENFAYIFDPYYKDKPFNETDIILDYDHLFEYNRIVPLKYFNCEKVEIYALGEKPKREAVIVSRADK